MAEEKKDDKKKDDDKKKAPEFGPSEPVGDGIGDWIFYLQQMLNYKYQMQVVEENGKWDSATKNAVQHFNEYYGLGKEAKVTADTWKELGHQDPSSTSSSSSSSSSSGSTEGEHFDEIEKDVNLVETDNSDLVWASAVATMLNSRGGVHTIDSVCQQADRRDRVGFSDLRTFAQEKFQLVSVNVRAKVGASWSAVLKDHGPLLIETNDDHRPVVVCGIKPNGDHAEIHAIDPMTKRDLWLNLEKAFLPDYGLNPEANLTVLGVN